MKNFTSVFSFFFLAFVLFFEQRVQAQAGVLNPNDPVVTFNGTLPAQPAFGQVGKWIRTVRMGWNTDSYKAYIYKGVAFRLKFPKTYNPSAADGKKYPMMVFFHGIGEAAAIYDNEFHLLHGADFFNAAVESGSYDGYILYMQSQGFWGTGLYKNIKELIDYMVTNNKVDPFRVSANGLSSGGMGATEMLVNYPAYINACLPMSGVSIAYRLSNVVDVVKYTPMWSFQGGLDNSPAPSTATQVRDAMLAAGGNYKLTIYPNLGHGTWWTVWGEPDFIPFMLRAYKSNPWPLSGKTVFCNGETINTTLGLSAGFDNYEWRKNDVIIPGATTNTIQVTQPGKYDARVLKGSLWSEWSPAPVQISTQPAAPSPTIQIAGLMSKVIPALDGNNSVALSVPAIYSSYLWQKVGQTTTLSTTNTLNATSAGDYVVKVTQPNTCPTNFSPAFTVVNANGANKPDPATNLVVTPLTGTSLRLNWGNTPAPAYNETGFEIYQATVAGGPYKFITLTAPDVLTYTVNGLLNKTRYYYKIRAVNNTGAAAASNEANGTTLEADGQAPTAPANLQITGNYGFAVSLQWSASTDNVGVSNYEISINGQKSYVTNNQTSYAVFNLIDGGSYAFTVKAKDAAGNISQASNPVSIGSIGVPSNTAYNVYMNFNKDNPGASPWNNTNGVPVVGNAYLNLITDQAKPTNLNMTVTSPFIGENALGMNTGNNSGIVEDKVLKTVWVADRAAPGTLKIDGLNLAMTYTIVFFASQDGFAGAPDKTSVYTIGTNSVSYNCVNNISGYVYIPDVKPDPNGSVEVKIGAGGTSPFGYIGVMAIMGVPSPESLIGESPRSSSLGEISVPSASTYPNPFVNDVNLKLSLEKMTDKISIVVTDVTGKAIFTKDLRQVPKGNSTHQLGINGKSLVPGIYFIRISGLPEGRSKTIKLIK